MNINEIVGIKLGIDLPAIRGPVLWNVNSMLKELTMKSGDNVVPISNLVWDLDMESASKRHTVWATISISTPFVCTGPTTVSIVWNTIQQITTQSEECKDVYLIDEERPLGLYDIGAFLECTYRVLL